MRAIQSNMIMLVTAQQLVIKSFWIICQNWALRLQSCSMFKKIKYKAGNTIQKLSHDMCRLLLPVYKLRKLKARCSALMIAMQSVIISTSGKMILVYLFIFCRFSATFSHPEFNFYLKLIYNFILQSIIMHYITFKIKFLLLVFNLTPFLRKKRLPASAFTLTSSPLKPVI